MGVRLLIISCMRGLPDDVEYEIIEKEMNYVIHIKSNNKIFDKHFNKYYYNNFREIIILDNDFRKLIDISISIRRFCDDYYDSRNYKH